jgi:hypothetical protein
MIDVHAPHKKIHGLGEFFIHLLTITVGLLIATQIESCVEWRHHVHLAENARTSLRAEIDHNLGDLKDAESGVKKWREEVDNGIKAMKGIQDHPNDPAAQKTSLALNFHSFQLRDTAWKTAQATEALGYMPYDEAQRYADIYQAQSDLLEAQKRPAEDVAYMVGLLNRFNWNEHNKITEDQASQMAEYLGRMKLHVVALDLQLQRNIETNQAFVENRKARDDFHESFN